AFFDGITGTFSEATGMGLLGGIYALAVLIPSLAVSVRRLHDTDRSGWWLLIALVPLIGAIVLLVFLVLDSNSGQNQYGANPKDVIAGQGAAAGGRLPAADRGMRNGIPDQPANHP